jgi:hypothetical protein
MASGVASEPVGSGASVVDVATAPIQCHNVWP